MIFDLTHVITEDMPVYPGDREPVIMKVASVNTDGFMQTTLHISSHTGTHMDAPAHMLERGGTLDTMDVSAFCGRAYALDCRGVEAIGMTLIDAHRQECDAAEFILLCTGKTCLWGGAAYYEDYPVMNSCVTAYLASSHKKGVGVDVMSIDPVGASCVNHRAVLGSGIVIIENLCIPDQLIGCTFTLYALPICFSGADGAPVRAVAVL